MLDTIKNFLTGGGGDGNVNIDPALAAQLLNSGLDFSNLGTGLSDFLREAEVETTYIMGMATDYCVKFTALDACRDGFEVFLIEDGCRGVELEAGDTDAAISEMRVAGVTIVTSGQIGT